MKKNWGKYLLILVPIIIAIAVLIPTFQAYTLEKTHQDFLKRARAEKTPTDSLAVMEKFNKEYRSDYEKAKANQLKLGLDLRGGMYVTMEVDVLKMIQEAAHREAIDDVFMQVVDKTREDQKTSDEETMDLFMKNFNAIARPKGKTLISYFDIGDIKDASEENIVKRLNENAKDAIDRAVEVIRQRIDQFGVSEVNIQKQSSRRIVVEMPGVENEAQMRNLLQTTARLEFNLVRNNKQIVMAFDNIDRFLARENKIKRGIKVDSVETTTPETSAVKGADVAEKSKMPAGDSTKADTAKTDTAKKDTAKDPYAGMSQDEIRKKHLEDHPFTSLFATYYIPPQEGQQPIQFFYTTKDIPEGEYMFRILKDSLAKFQAILNRFDVGKLIPQDLKVAVEAKPDQRLLKANNVEVFDFYSVKREPELTGEYITDARESVDPTTNAPIVNMEMNADGADRWAVITGANLKKRIAIILDDRVYTAPVVQSKITGGRSQISGMANIQEAHLLSVILKAGALKAPVQIVEERVVGPSLGEDSIRDGITASLIAFIFVIAYMVFYYKKGGLVADFAVFINVLLVVATLAALKGSLSLPGIAGIILTIGMAVDANVLIFERIREELAKGRSLKSSVDEGFGKALAAIIDSNVTTAMTGAVLYIFGSGPIQGFALTLLVGIAATLFTQIAIARAVIELSLSGGTSEYNFGQPKISNDK